MATSFKEIKRQIAALEKKADEARKVEAAKVIAGIRKQITEYELTSEDLFKSLKVDAKASISTKVAKRRKTAQKPANPPKYMDPKTGKTWTGNGKAPGWIVAAIRRNKKDDFLIDKVKGLQAAKVAAKSVTPTKPVKAGRAKPAATKSAAAKNVVRPTAKNPITAKPVAKATAVKSAAKVAPTGKKASAPKKTAIKRAKALVTTKKTRVIKQPAPIAPAPEAPDKTASA
ncbi:MAG: H-NS family nucleoid-associated regulatory protein [Gallionellaceae bacterium]|nr:H-NS family nucleoid-associated regulatory protein [Gallionellaceae bacterium]